MPLCTTPYFVSGFTDIDGPSVIDSVVSDPLVSIVSNTGHPFWKAALKVQVERPTPILFI